MAQTSQPNVVLSDISYEFGESAPIEALAKSARDAEAVEVMLIGGLERYWQSTRSTCELATRSIAQSLRSSGLHPSEIDAVFFASESVWDAPGVDCRDSYRAFRRQVLQLLYESGMRHAYPVGLMFSGCSNLVTAVAQASDSIRAGRFRRALVVVADRLPQHHSRILPPGVAVVSDGAASCLLTSDALHGFRLEASVLHADTSAWSIDLEADFDKFGGYLVNLGKQLLTVGKLVSERANLRPDQYRHLLTNNYSLSTVRLFCAQLGFKNSQLMTENLPRYGHANAVDLLLNLRTLEDTQALNVGDRVLTLASATATWGALSFSYLGKRGVHT